IGGGRDSAGNSNNAQAVANGSVTVDLSNSAVDTQALGLSAYSTTANVGTALGNITGGTTAGNVDFTFYGTGASGYESGITVTASGVNTAGSLSDVVNDINAAIATTSNTAGAANTAFAADGIQAELNGAGTGITFTSANGAFAVANGVNGVAAADNILGSTAAVPVFANGTQQVNLDYGTPIGGTDTQDLTFTAVDASGALHQTEVSLVAGTKDAQITAINAALQAAGGPLANIVAVDADGIATGAMTLTGSGSFNVAVGAGTTADGFTTTTATQSVIANSALVGTASALDVSTASDAGLAVTAIGNAVANLGSAQAVVGKGENTLTFATNLAQSQLTNEAVSESGLRDANMATEAANLTKAQILLQAGVAALAQANSAPQNILTLLKG
ncbi:MAG TPA: flagellin, partial [Bryobacteraceae bacterium]|nr:flagellin [Bryobacteraceae bacterium]